MARGCPRRERLLELAELLPHLAEGIACRGPIEPDARRFLAHACRGMQRRKIRRQAAQHRPIGIGRFGGALGGFDARPVRSTSALSVTTVSAKTWGWRRIILATIAIHDIVDREVSGLGCDLRLHDDLQQEIAELVLEVDGLGRSDGVEDLVGFLEQARAQALPGSARGPTGSLRVRAAVSRRRSVRRTRACVQRPRSR